MNPVEKYLEYPLNKSAGFLGGMGRAVHPTSLGHLAGQAGVIMGAAGIGAAATKAYYAATKASDYKKMLGSNPDLREYQQSNPSQFKQHYSSLRSINPQFASDPTVAGTYMRQMSLNPQSAGKTIVESVEAQPTRKPMMEFGRLETGPGLETEDLKK